MSVPQPSSRSPSDEPLLRVENLRVHFPLPGRSWLASKGVVRAVDGVDLNVASGELVGLIGESGSGKTTLGRALARLIEPTSGTVRFMGRDFLSLQGRALRSERRHLQMIFQDPYGSLNPRHRVGRILAEPIRAHRLGSPAEVAKKVASLLEQVELPPESVHRYPHEFSGGQRQRIGIARALATEPRLIVADEPVSALDISIRAQVLNLLARLRDDLGLALLFIGHDLALIERVADRVAVMYLGKIAEIADRSRLFSAPAHPYTVALLSAVPNPDPRHRSQRIELGGEPGNAADPPAGCPFHPRCPIARDRCSREVPALESKDSRYPEHRVACHFPSELVAAQQV